MQKCVGLFGYGAWLLCVRVATWGRAMAIGYPGSNGSEGLYICPNNTPGGAPANGKLLQDAEERQGPPS